MDAIFKLYEGLDRLGPGSREATLTALDVVKEGLPSSSKVIDIGCGTGAQTLDLAKNINGEIIAVDIYQPFLDTLLQKANLQKLKSNIKTLNENMINLSFPKSYFDLIWSEGAIYLAGMEKSLRAWKNFLVPNGFIVFSEISWFKENPPKKVIDFWNTMYPDLHSVRQNVEIIEKIGLKVIHHFSLSSDTWWVNYYDPLIKRMEKIDKNIGQNKDLQIIIDETYEEIELFRTYSDWYGYEFYIAQDLNSE